MKSSPGRSMIELAVLGSLMLLSLVGTAFLIGNATGDWVAVLIIGGVYSLFIPLILRIRYLSGLDPTRAAQLARRVRVGLRWVLVGAAIATALFVMYLLARNN